jgi:predicted O-methyltransferase YrrM
MHRPRRYDYLFEEIKKNKTKRLLEIGTWNGRRAKKMIETALASGGGVEYYGFDLFEQMTEAVHARELSKRPPRKKEVEQFLSGPGVKIALFQGYTTDTLPKAVPALPQMDFIFIDGGHSIETIANDWEWCRKLMRADTVVVFDDYYFDRDDVGAKAVIEKIDPSLYSVEILPIRDRFKKEWGVLSINFVRVFKKPRT